MNALKNAVRNLINSNAYEATLTWDGAESYVVQPSEKYCPIDDGHYAILTKEAAENWNDGELVDNEETVNLLASWIADNQTQWRQDECERQTDI